MSDRLHDRAQRVLWNVVMAGLREPGNAAVVRAYAPNEDLFSENDAVGSFVTLWRRPDEYARFRIVAGYDDAFMAAVLRQKPDDANAIGQAAIVWARLDDGKAFKALSTFPHGPTLLLREGGSVRRVAVWALDRSLPLEWIEKANKRLAYKLGAKQKWGHPEQMWLPVPGSTLRAGREKRPLAVRADVVAPDRVYVPRELVGRLKDPPPPRDWSQDNEDRRAA